MVHLGPTRLPGTIEPMVPLRLLPSGPRTLVIGAGFLGTAVGEALIAAGREITVLSRSPLSEQMASRLPGARILIGDATDGATVATALEQVADVVYCAGSPVPAQAEADPLRAERQTLPPLLTVLEALRRREAIPLLFLSSGGTVYGEPTVDPVPENHPLRPSSVYAALKVAAEQHLLVYRNHHGVRATSLRCANPFGVGQLPGRDQGVIASLLSADAPVPIYGDGSAVRDYIEVHDLAGVVVALRGRLDVPPTINVGTGIGTSLLELLDVVRAVTGRPIPVCHEPARPTDLRRVVLDIALLRSLVRDFAPAPLREGIVRMCDPRQPAANVHR